MQKAALIALQKASASLLYPSETDEPFEAFSWGKANGDLSAAKARELAGARPDEAVKEVTLGDFFKNLTSDEVENADKYQALLKVVNEQLSGVKVFRFGDVELAIYLVGKTKEGEWAGLKTKAVET
ncbi:MAG TPA: nuclease A inhibitor family protein [Planctomycetales bacterium]|jgi:hypothetical protein|nr:nuclease A inhibitor family protein [Planctomycetales bacterium]